MQIGMIGLGRMGANMVRRLLRGGHECVVNDRNPDAVKALGRKAQSLRRRWTVLLRSSSRRARFG